MKLFTILQQLNSRELTKFQYFLQSPLYNQREDVQHLLTCWLGERGRRCLAEYYWAKIYPQKNFSTAQWHLLTSRLFQLLEEFLALEEMRTNEAQKKYYLAKAYRKIKQEKRFKSAIKAASKLLEKQSLRNTDYLRQKHDLSFEQYDYIISINRKEKTNLQEVSDHLDHYILAAKLRQACYALSRENIKEEVYQIGFLTELLQYVEQHRDCLNVPAVAIYYYCYQVIRSNDNEHYFRLLREAISAYPNYFPPSEMRDIYTLAINYAIRKLNAGSSLFIREAYELYLLILDQGYLLEDGIMLESTFSNVVSLAINLRKYKWTQAFIYQYQQSLKPAFRQPMFHFSLGKLYYEQGELEQSLKALTQVETKASFLFLGARILQLKIYYELEEFDPLESLLESLRVYIQRSSDLSYRREHYNNILIFTRQLLQLPVMDKTKRAQFRERIEAVEIFSEKEWFLRQINS